MREKESESFDDKIDRANRRSRNCGIVVAIGMSIAIGSGIGGIFQSDYINPNPKPEIVKSYRQVSDRLYRLKESPVTDRTFLIEDNLLKTRNDLARQIIKSPEAQQYYEWKDKASYVGYLGIILGMATAFYAVSKI